MPTEPIFYDVKAVNLPPRFGAKSELKDPTTGYVAKIPHWGTLGIVFTVGNHFVDNERYNLSSQTPSFMVPLF